MAQIQTPGVYIVEKNAFPNSVVEVATAVPVFIGYTEQASYQGNSMRKKAVKISSLLDYHTFFGHGPLTKFELKSPASASTDTGKKTDDTEEEAKNESADTTPPAVISPKSTTLTLNGTTYNLTPVATQFYMYNCIRLYFENNGGPCYIYSIGSFSDSITLKNFQDALAVLQNEQEPTMILAPDALLLKETEYSTLLAEILTHCEAMQNRVALFDVYGGNIDNVLDVDARISSFRTDVGTKALNYGAAYFPWVNTTVVPDTEISFMNLKDDTSTPNPKEDPKADPKEDPKEDPKNEGKADPKTDPKEDPKADPKTNPDPTAKPGFSTYLETDIPAAIWSNVMVAQTKAASAQTDKDKEDAAKLVKQAHQALFTSSNNYKNIINALSQNLNTLPVSGAMAGIYAYVDKTRGVWKAPANISLTGVVSPTVNLNDAQQANLNIDANTGKSVNAIRFFNGLGVLAWGARTLDGNSQDWRYINVRRTLIMLEQSIKLAARAYVFEPNDSNTWASVKSMLNNFLTDQWKKGALVGAKPEDAFTVSIGLGSTMTGDDILNGYMNITVMVAVSRPAEFIVITFQQQMQKS